MHHTRHWTWRQVKSSRRGPHAELHPNDQKTRMLPDTRIHRKPSSRIAFDIWNSKVKTPGNFESMSSMFGFVEVLRFQRPRNQDIRSCTAQIAQVDPVIPCSISNRLNPIQLHPLLLTSCMAKTIGSMCRNVICHWFPRYSESLWIAGILWLASFRIALESLGSDLQELNLWNPSGICFLGPTTGLYLHP